jgi:DNA-directed RNA polymerase beta' subunit
MKASIELLTDDDIVDYTRSDGKDRILVNHKDFDLRRNTPYPISGGVYDTEIFGSPFEDRCVCGKIRRFSSSRCRFMNPCFRTETILYM